MKQIKTILLAVFIVAVYSSCHKSSPPTTSVSYNNNTFTTVDITVNGNNYTIQPGTSLILRGTDGDAVNASASTEGAGGLTLTWSFADNFPPNGILDDNINVSSDYFYLEVANTSSYTIAQEYVNYQLSVGGSSVQTYDQVTIPNDGSTYGIGYYDAFNNSNLYLETASGITYWKSNIYSLPFTQNQYYIYTATN